MMTKEEHQELLRDVDQRCLETLPGYPDFANMSQIHPIFRGIIDAWRRSSLIASRLAQAAEQPDQRGDDDVARHSSS